MTHTCETLQEEMAHFMVYCLLERIIAIFNLKTKVRGIKHCVLRAAGQGLKGAPGRSATSKSIISGKIIASYDFIITVRNQVHCTVYSLVGVCIADLSASMRARHKTNPNIGYCNV